MRSPAGPPQGCVLREVLEQHWHRLCLDRQPAQAVEYQPDSLCQVRAQLLNLIFHWDLFTFTVTGANNILIWYFIHFRSSCNKRLNLFEGRSRAMWTRKTLLVLPLMGTMSRVDQRTMDYTFTTRWIHIIIKMNSIWTLCLQGLSKHLFQFKFDAVRSFLDRDRKVFFFLIFLISNFDLELFCKEEDVNEFVSAVCWKANSNVMVAANSQGTIKVLELV